MATIVSHFPNIESDLTGKPVEPLLF